MDHKNIIWNPGTKQWFCTTCGRTTDGANIEEARAELDKHKCIIPSLDVAGAAPVIETIRLIRNPYKMALRTERSASRFAVKTDEGKVLIRLEVFHDTVAALKSASVAFELLAGTTAEQASALVDAMNERIVGVMVTPKESA